MLWERAVKRVPLDYGGLKNFVSWQHDLPGIHMAAWTYRDVGTGPHTLSLLHSFWGLDYAHHIGLNYTPSFFIFRRPCIRFCLLRAEPHTKIWWWLWRTLVRKRWQLGVSSWNSDRNFKKFIRIQLSSDCYDRNFDAMYSAINVDDWTIVCQSG